MDIIKFFSLAADLQPLSPDLAQAMATLQKIADAVTPQELQQLMQTAEKLMPIVQKLTAK